MARLDQILVECLDEVRNGRASVDDVLARYPAHRAELEPLLRLALRIPPMPEAQPSAEFRQRARLAVQAEVQHVGLMTRVLRNLTRPFSNPLPKMYPRLATPAVAGMVAAGVFVAGGGVAYASQGSLPGEALYPVKAATERGRMLVTFSPEAKALLNVELSQRRVDEVVALAEAGKPIGARTVEAIGNHIDAALEEASKLQGPQAQVILDKSSSQWSASSSVIEEASKKGMKSKSSEASLSWADVMVSRGQLIAKAGASDQSVLTEQSVVTGVRESEINGTVTSLMPLRIGGTQVTTSSSTEVKGDLSVGAMAQVKGTILSDGSLRASKIEVQKEEKEAQKVEKYEGVDLRGMITLADPLTVAGRKIVIQPNTELRGTPRVGLMVRVRGELRPDGTILATRLETELLNKEGDLRGVITSLDPLIIGGVVVQGVNAESKAKLRVGDVARVQGRYADDGQIKAYKIESEPPEESKEQELTGTVLAITGNRLTVEKGDGSKVTLSVSDKTQFEGIGQTSRLKGLTEGAKVSVKFDLNTQVAMQVKVEKTSDGGNGQGSGKGAQERQIEGTIAAVDGSKVSIAVDRGSRTTVNIIGDTKIVGKDNNTASVADVTVGRSVRVTYDTDSTNASKVELLDPGSTGSSGGGQKQERQIEGKIVVIDGVQVTIESDNGSRTKVNITRHTEIKGRGSVTVLTVGQDVRVSFDADSREALQVEVLRNPNPPGGRQKQTVEGKVVAVSVNRVTIEASNGSRTTVNITNDTDLTSKGDSAKKADLVVGRAVRATFDSISTEASKIELLDSGSDGNSRGGDGQKSGIQELRGKIVAVSDSRVTVEASDGTRTTVTVTSDSQIDVGGKAAGTIADLRVGRTSKVTFDSNSANVLRMDVSDGPGGSGGQPTPTATPAQAPTPTQAPTPGTTPTPTATPTRTPVPNTTPTPTPTAVPLPTAVAQQQVVGRILAVGLNQLTIVADGGAAVTVTIADATSIKSKGIRGTFADLAAGRKVVVQYDPNSRVASEVEVDAASTRDDNSKDDDSRPLQDEVGSLSPAITFF